MIGRFKIYGLITINHCNIDTSFFRVNTGYTVIIYGHGSGRCLAFELNFSMRMPYVLVAQGN